MRAGHPLNKARSGLVWCGTIICFNVTSRGGYRYAAIFKDMGSEQLETFVMTHRSDLTAEFRTMIWRLRDDPRFSAWTVDTSTSATIKEHGMFLIHHGLRRGRW